MLIEEWRFGISDEISFLYATFVENLPSSEQHPLVFTQYKLPCVLFTEIFLSY
jgi:hypothetical protein